MSKPVGEYINLREEWELNYALRANDLAESKDNRDKLISLLNKNREDNKNIKWDTVHKLIKENKLSFDSVNRR